MGSPAQTSEHAKIGEPRPSPWREGQRRCGDNLPYDCQGTNRKGTVSDIVVNPSRIHIAALNRVPPDRAMGPRVTPTRQSIPTDFTAVATAIQPWCGNSNS